MGRIFESEMSKREKYILFKENNVHRHEYYRKNTQNNNLFNELQKWCYSKGLMNVSKFNYMVNLTVKFSFKTKLYTNIPRNFGYNF